MNEETTKNLGIPKEAFESGIVDARTFNEAMELIDALIKNTGGAVAVASGPAGDPDEVIVSGVNLVRFMTEFAPGGHHVAFDAGSGECWIGVSPPPATLQGQSLVVYPAKYTGGLSLSGTATYKPADPAGSIVSYITRGNAWGVSTPAACFGFASVGLLILSLNSVDVATIDLGANFVEANRATGQNCGNYNTQGAGDPIVGGVVSFPGGNLQINTVAPSGAPADAYQKGNATVTVNGCLIEGYSTIQLRHDLGGGTVYTANLFECYEDYDPPGPINDPAITLLDMALNILAIKWLSGVQYCGMGTTFLQDLTAPRCANNVYHASSLLVTLDQFTGLSLNRPSFAECGVAPFPTVGDTLQFIDRIVTLDTPNEYSEDARLRGIPRDPYGAYSALLSPAIKILVSTYGNVSTNLWEPCHDENWRLPAGAYDAPPAPWTGHWDSTGNLNTYDDTTGLQFRAGGVYYPEFDYTGYVPSAGQPDYTTIWAANNPRWLWRGFRDAGMSHSNGMIQLPGITEADLLAENIRVWIKVPTRTGWLRLHGSLYNPVGWTGVDDDPCRTTGGSGNIFAFTLATLGTNPASDWGIVVRVEIPSRTAPEISGAWGMTAW